MDRILKVKNVLPGNRKMDTTICVVKYLNLNLEIIICILELETQKSYGI